MKTYKVRYHIISKKTVCFYNVAYISCTGREKIQELLEGFYSDPRPNGVYYHPVIDEINGSNYYCIVEKDASPI